MSFFLQIWREINEKIRFSTMWDCPWLTSNTIGHLVTWWHFIQRSSSFLPNAPGPWPLGHGYLPSLLSELLRQNPRSCDFSAARPLTLRRNGGSRFWDFWGKSSTLLLFSGSAIWAMIIMIVILTIVMIFFCMVSRGIEVDVDEQLWMLDGDI